MSPTKRELVARTAVLTGVLAAGSASAQPAWFQALGDLPGGGIVSAVGGISADGATVVGMTEDGSPYRAFRWTAGTGMVGLDPPVGVASFRNAGGVSADGAVVVGTGALPGGASVATRWTLAGGAAVLAGPPGGFTGEAATGVSDDGWVVVGDAWKQTNESCSILGPGGGTYIYYLDDYTAWRKEGSGAAKPLKPTGSPDYVQSFATELSGDGTTAVGASTLKSQCAGVAGFAQASLWRGTEGTVLGFLPGADASYARGVSDDGSVVVGWSGKRAFRWTQGGGMTDLGVLPGLTESHASAVSADGSVVVGSSWSAATGSRAFIWDETEGLRDLQDVLQGLGVNLPGWTLGAAADVSADGRTIAGNGTNPAGQWEAWIAFLGDAVCYADCNDDEALSVADFGCFQTKFVAADPYADCNVDGQLTVADFGCFQTRFVGGCP